MMPKKGSTWCDNCDFIEAEVVSSTVYSTLRCKLHDRQLQIEPSWFKPVRCKECIDSEEIDELDDKIEELEDFYNAFVYEMDLMLHTIKKLRENNEDGS